MSNLLKLDVLDASATRDQEDKIVQQALEILKKRLHSASTFFESPQAAKDYLRIKLAECKAEVFGCVFLNTRYGVIADEIMFHGTLDKSCNYPREVMRRTLEHNAAAVVLYHNHPSGDVRPSLDDMTLTSRLKATLALIDVQVVDHFIVGGSAKLEITSFAERKLL